MSSYLTESDASDPDTGHGATEPEELGVGATVLSSIFAVLVGAVVGVVTTFTHAQWAPWGLLAGLLIVAALVGGFRLVFESRVVGLAAALGVIGASAVLALPGAGGVLLTANDIPGLVWSIAPTVVSAVVLLWPRRARKGTRRSA